MTVVGFENLTEMTAWKPAASLAYAPTPAMLALMGSKNVVVNEVTHSG